MTRLLCACLLTVVASAGPLEIRAIDGSVLHPLEPAGPAGVLLFVATDCPVSNRYAPEIQSICAAYQSRGVHCTLMYEQAAAEADDVRRHLREYRYGSMAAAVDADGRVAAAVHASVTPEAVVVDRQGGVRYRGRIDNLYAALGTPRQVVTSHDLRGALDAVLDGTAVPHADVPAIGCYIVPPAQRRK